MSLSRSATRHGRSTVAALAAAGALALLLSGCTSGDPAPSQTSSPDAAEPIFASDEEALAAAVEAYEDFALVSDGLSANPTADSSAIESVTTPRYAPDFIASLAEFHAAGLRTTGTIERRDFELAQSAETPGPVADVQMYVCVDYSQSGIVNSSGQFVTPEGRQPLTRSLVRLVGESEGSKRLLVDSTELWDNSDGC
ncbi:hypothetical protein DCE93_12375 [Agromyces badenianii]|uniref:Lipoprotein n=1 Tax=Agromyces badenianii TaxID=2080742 RepID=A0A2S0WYE7_9MICO|nr:hypothetical protein [Agromyces badenianii]AWB96346.1 hypothetical protein DCE93_12375 [Agromyces badenianii]